MGLIPGKLSLKQWLIALSGIVISITVIVLLLNSGPNLPPVSYVPRQIDISIPGEEINNAPEAGQDSNNGPDKDAAEPRSGGWGTRMVIPPDLSNEEKLALIEKNYKKALNNLSDAYLKEINRLIKCAKEDYLTAKNGHKDTSVSKLALEYFKLGQSLEKDCDRNFYRIMDAMKNDLSSNNLPLDMADQAEQAYKEQKSQARKEIMAMVTRYSK